MPQPRQTKPRRFYATTPKGMATLLADEVTALGATRVQSGTAGVSFDASLEVAYRLCLWGRIVNRVLMPVTDVPAETPEQLYEEVKAIRWERHLASNGTLAIDVSAIRPTISHTRYATLKCKDAIVDRFQEQFDERPSVDLERPDLRINLHLREGRARISIDLSGGSLHRRGYRSEGAEAPLKENLAAAILQLAGWPERAADGATLLDPMCGSGTLLVEGALMAADIAPGLLREHFGFLGWRGHEPELWEGLLEEAEDRRRVGLERLPPIQGFDTNPKTLEAAVRNIERAGLDEYIVLSRHEFSSELPIRHPEKGMLVTNPPYGERLGEVEALRPLYRTLGELLRGQLADWPAAVFTANAMLAAELGLSSQKPIALFNGLIPCQLLRYRPRPKVALSDDEREELTHSPGAEMVRNRLRKNMKHIGKWARREGISCYRLYDADLPEYAFAIDLYQGEKLWVHIQEYQAPATVNEVDAMRRTQELLAVVPQLLTIPTEQLFFKTRQKQRGTAQYEKQASAGEFHQVTEGGCRLWVNFSDYLDTGLFLDHRPTRALVGSKASGRRFLNLFCYTATATVHAALAGATSSVSIDMSNTYIDWARRNFEINNIDPEQHRLLQADCMKWLAEAIERGEHYDLIFIDPPTFSTSKRMEGTFDVQRDHAALLTQAALLLDAGGEIIFSNNLRRFRLDREALEPLDLVIEEISAATIPEDFRRNPRIHNCWRLSKPDES